MKMFKDPTMEIVKITAEDVIATSLTPSNPNPDEDTTGDDEL